MSAASRGANNNGESCDSHVNDQEQLEIRRGLEDLLARPPPSFDCRVPDNSGSQHRDYPLQLAGHNAASSSLPELFLSRTGDRAEERRCSSESMAGSALKNTGEGRWTSKPTRSQSGGHLRPAPCSTVASASRGAPASFSRRGGAASAGAGPTNSTTAVAASFKGLDAVLLEQAFAFAERVAREEEAGGQDGATGRREGRRLRRDGGGSGAELQLHGCEKGGRLRRTRSSGSSVAFETGGGVSGGSGAGGSRIEVEDWVRGLAGSSLHGSLSQRQLNHQQSSRSINQANVNNTISGLSGGVGGGHQARVSRRGKLTVGLRKKQDAEEMGNKWRFDRRREKEGKKRATATAELVQQFESGTGVAALRAELEASQASMRRSTEAIEQVASGWHQGRSMFPPAAGTGEDDKLL